MTDWNVEEAKDSIRNGGRFGAKRVMEAVYRNNIDVFRHWGCRSTKSCSGSPSNSTR